MFSVLGLLAFLAVLFTACEKKSDTVIDPSYDSPVISNIYKSKDTVFTTSGAPVISFFTALTANANGGARIRQVTCKLTAPDNSTLGTFTMYDDGYAPDSTAGDSRYSCNVNANITSCLLVGNYTVQYIAQNETGLYSNAVNSALFLINTANLPPVLSNAALPDSVIRPVSGSFDLTLTITATDPDGDCDVFNVYFDAYRPSGSFIGTIPMTAAGSNIWTFTNPVLPSAADSSYGYFKYFFRSADRSGALSTYYRDSIKFVRPN